MGWDYSLCKEITFVGRFTRVFIFAVLGMLLVTGMLVGCANTKESPSEARDAEAKSISQSQEPVEAEGVRVNIDADNAYLLVDEQVVVGTIFLHPFGRPIEFEVGCDRGFTVESISAYQTGNSENELELLRSGDRYSIAAEKAADLEEITVVVETSGEGLAGENPAAKSLSESKSGAVSTE